MFHSAGSTESAEVRRPCCARLSFSIVDFRLDIAKYYKSFTQPVLLRRSRRQLAQMRVPVEVFAIRRTLDQTAATPPAGFLVCGRKGPRFPERQPAIR